MHFFHVDHLDRGSWVLCFSWVFESKTSYHLPKFGFLLVVNKLLPQIVDVWFFLMFTAQIKFSECCVGFQSMIQPLCSSVINAIFCFNRIWTQVVCLRDILDFYLCTYHSDLAKWVLCYSSTRDSKISHLFFQYDYLPFMMNHRLADEQGSCVPFCAHLTNPAGSMKHFFSVTHQVMLHRHLQFYCLLFWYSGT